MKCAAFLTRFAAHAQIATKYVHRVLKSCSGEDAGPQIKKCNIVFVCVRRITRLIKS